MVDDRRNHTDSKIQGMFRLDPGFHFICHTCHDCLFQKGFFMCFEIKGTSMGFRKAVLGTIAGPTAAGHVGKGQLALAGGATLRKLRHLFSRGYKGNP
jgi:hypothetical protein